MDAGARERRGGLAVLSRDLRALLEKAGATRSQRGLAAPEARLCQGAVYVIPREPETPGRLAESVVAFPALRLPGAGPRADHDYRVIVLTPSALCDDDELNTVHVVPCSTSARGLCSPHDLEIAATEFGFSKANRAYVSIIQPVLKSDLTASGRTGMVSGETLRNLLGRWERLRTG